MPGLPKLIVKGDKALIRKLRKLSDRRQLRRILKKATNAAGQVVVKGVRAEWPTDSGLSKRSVTKKVIYTKAGYEAIIGIDRQAESETHSRLHVPSNIDHLIELGWQTPEGKTIPARAPLRRGYENTKDAALRTFEEKATSELEREAAKR